MDCFRDPDHALVVALVFNGMPAHQAHYRRQEDVMTAIYEDLGLVAAGSPGRSRPFPKIGLL